jgi:hypothetical protein
MQRLYDSKGKHIADLIDNRLYNAWGANVGHYVPGEGILVDLQGLYLGEILFDNRLVYNRHSPKRFLNLGRQGDYGNGGYCAPGGGMGYLGLPGSYNDIPPTRLAYT